MKKILTIAGIMVIVMVMSAATIMALPLNVRPVAIGTSSEQPLGGPGGIFDTIGADSYIDSISTQSNAAIFTNAASGAAVASFIIAIAGNASGNESGIYEYGDTTNLIPIFSGAVSGPTSASIYFLADGSVHVSGIGDIVTGDYSDFGNSFGFYLKGAGGTWFSEDDKNNSNSPQALIYQGNGLDFVTVPGLSGGTFGSQHWIVAWEDLQRVGGTADGDYNDLVYIVESVRPGGYSAQSDHRFRGN